MGAVSLNKFIITQSTTLPAMTIAAGTAGEPNTGGAAGYGNASGTPGTPVNSYDVKPLEFIAGTPILLDSGTPSALYSALNGLGVLRAYVAGQDDVSHAATSN